jgi:hypothetical protein
MTQQSKTADEALRRLANATYVLEHNERARGTAAEARRQEWIRDQGYADNGGHFPGEPKDGQLSASVRGGIWALRALRVKKRLQKAGGSASPRLLARADTLADKAERL